MQRVLHPEDIVGGEKNGDIATTACETIHVFFAVKPKYIFRFQNG